MKCARSESNKREDKFKKRLKPNANSLINQQKVNKTQQQISKSRLQLDIDGQNQQKRPKLEPKITAIL